MRMSAHAPSTWVDFTPEEFGGNPQGAPEQGTLAAITRINHLLLAPESHRSPFASIARLCATTFDYPFVSILLFDEDLQSVEVAGVSDPDINLLVQRRGPNVVYKRTFPLALLQGTLWLESVRSGRIYVTGRPAGLYTPFVPAARIRTLVGRLGIRQGVVLPLMPRGRLMGALTVGSGRHEYQPGERAGLVAFANHTAVAAEMWRLYDRAEGRTAVLKRLHTLSQTITGILDLDILYGEIAHAAGLLANVDFCTVNTLTPDLKGYRNHAAWGAGLRAEVATGVRSVDIFSPEIVARAFRGEPILVPDLASYPAARERLSHRGARSVAIFPFRSEGKAVGFITVGRDMPGEWEAETVEILKELTEYVTVAYTNARRFAEARRQADVQRALAESASLIARAETRSVLPAIVEAGSRLFMDSRFALLLPGRDGDLNCVAAHGPGTEDLLGFWVRSGEGLVGKVFQSSEPMLSTDVQAEADSARGDIDRQANFHSYMAVPLMSEAGCIGVLVAGHPEVGLYGAADLSLLATLADHASIALQNERLLIEARQTAAQHEALAHSAHMIARAETDTVLQTVVDAGSALVMDSQFGVLLPNRHGDLVCVAAHGPQTDKVLGYVVHGGEGLIGKVFATQEPLLVEDVQAEPGSVRQDIDKAAQFHSWMAAPMMTEKECIGVLVASHTRLGVYTPAHLSLLKTLADHATIALEKVRLLQEAKRKAAEQGALAESANAIAHLDLQAVLHTIVARASEIVKSSRCHVALYDPALSGLRWAAGVDNDSALQEQVFQVGEGLVGQVFTTGEPLLVDDITLDPRSASRHIDELTMTRSFLCVPLRAAEGNVGVLVAVHHEVGVFTEHDLELLATFADYATIALSNARLYGSLQQREEERSRLLHQLMTGQEAERRRVAVDIHDGPLQSIGVNMLTVERIRRLVELGRIDEARIDLLNLREGLSAVVQELRDVINDLRPATLENLGLEAAASAFLTNFELHTGIKAHLESANGGRHLPRPAEVVFYRLLQEALTNVRKHARATDVWVTLGAANGLFSMSVTDNGRGFDPQNLAGSLEEGHIGLHSMQERIEAVGGSMEIASANGLGTRVTFWAPGSA